MIVKAVGLNHKSVIQHSDQCYCYDCKNTWDVNDCYPPSCVETNGSVEQIAKACHEVNRIWCETLGNTTQVSWEDAPDWQKQSAMNGVVFHLSNSTTPEQSHENWMKVKENEGWKYGPVKDVYKLEHPCMMPYKDLPKEQQVKDSLFKAIVDSFKN